MPRAARAVSRLRDAISPSREARSRAARSLEGAPLRPDAVQALVAIADALRLEAG